MKWYNEWAGPEKPDLGYVEFTRQWAADLLTKIKQVAERGEWCASPPLDDPLPRRLSPPVETPYRRGDEG